MNQDEQDGSLDRVEAGMPGVEGGEEKMIPVDVFVREVREGKRDPAGISQADRLNCVGYLVEEGMTTVEIARALSVCERTIWRDRRELRRESAMEPGLTVGDELLGDLQREAFNSAQKFERMAEDEKTPAYARLWAQREAMMVRERFVQTAFKLGYAEGGKGRLYQLKEERSRQKAAAEFARDYPDLARAGEERREGGVG